MSSHQVEVLLPVHNEGESIEATIREMHSELSRVTDIGFIVCEDGSRDNSKEVLRSLATELPIRLNLSDARKGYSKAMREGMEMCEADYLLCLDSDGQCDPAYFAEFWAAREEFDVIACGSTSSIGDVISSKTISDIPLAPENGSAKA